MSAPPATGGAHEPAIGGAREWNFDGLVGPSHSYAGLSPGNLASEAHRGRVSNPRAAALQGLEKMRRLHELGVAQAILPPHPRPALRWLRGLGFAGETSRVLGAAAREAPHLLAAAYSASSMWSANAATVTPGVDSGGGRVHFTPANLAGGLHRGLETTYTAALLRAIFADETHFAHHPPLPAAWGDEGAANHLRLAPSHAAPGLHVFVYGGGAAGDAALPRRYPARHREEASRAVARQHGLAPERAVFVQQAPAAIDAGVFHNDVIATADRDFLWLHEGAWADAEMAIETLRRRYASLGAGPLWSEVTPTHQVSLADAVSSYLFNCQLVEVGGGEDRATTRAWIGPEECRELETVRAVLEDLVAGSAPIDTLHFVELRESMRNGGGPACLRLRVVLRDDEARALHPGVRFTPERHAALVACVESHYRDRVEPSDLADPEWAQECLTAQRAVLEVLGLSDAGLPEAL